jgi:hypothetical protein
MKLVDIVCDLKVWVDKKNCKCLFIGASDGLGGLGRAQDILLSLLFLK